MLAAPRLLRLRHFFWVHLVCASDLQQPAHTSGKIPVVQAICCAGNLTAKMSRSTHRRARAAKNYSAEC